MANEKLRGYRAKRDFSKTSEPSGVSRGANGAVPRSEGGRFVVHKHAATADHYDLRLEVDGVLKSWAVPKGPSLDPAAKRLAVATEDHPLDYIDFEGVIPAGEYGGGPMIVWDEGSWAPMDDVVKSLSSGAFKFRLAGRKLNGGWMLARLKSKPGDGKRNWLLFKERDQSADTSIDILAARPESVKSGRRIEELLQPSPPAENAVRDRLVRIRPGALQGAVRRPAPQRIAPQLATASDSAPDGGDWLHEIKFDGYRTMAHLAGDGVRLLTRSGLDWTRRYGEIASAMKALPCREAIIDGEIVVVDEKGVSSFAKLQEALAQQSGAQLTFYAFDLLHLDGWDLTNVALDARKNALAGLLSGHATGASAVQFSDHVAGDGRELFDRASEMGLEGVVSKRASSPYISGRSKTWLKTKALSVAGVVIAGYTTSEAAGGLAALAVAEWVDGELRYRGKVGTGFDAHVAARLLTRLEELRGDATPLDGAPRGIEWVKPVLTAHVHYATRTSDGMLRHAVFKNLREAELAKGAAPNRRKLITDADLAAIWVTNPTRRLFGKSGPTKLDIAVYYASVGDAMLPQILGRPVSLVRCPTGRPQDCFFQRHPFTGMPPSVATFATTGSDDDAAKSYLAVEDAKGYLALAQFGVVEFHAWGALRRTLETPDRIVFDLDPGDGVRWREIVEAAIHIRDKLQALKLVPFVKTSGGKGAHVVVPVRPSLDWKQAHQAAKDFAVSIAAQDPGTFTAAMAKDKRKGRIFIDFHRNARGATAAAAYSLRARAHLPASTPLSWSDLESIDAPEDLNYSSVPGLLKTSGDPWAAMSESVRDLPVQSGARAGTVA